MSYPSFSELRRAQYQFRRDDHRLRLRFSAEHPHVLIERQTFRGRIGRMLNGYPYTPDAGRRREEGHVLIASVHVGQFNTNTVRAELREGDTWRQWDRNTDPLWRRVERADERREFERDVRRFMDAEHRASSLFDRYVWTNKQRVNVPVSVR